MCHLQGKRDPFLSAAHTLQRSQELHTVGNNPPKLLLPNWSWTAAETRKKGAVAALLASGLHLAGQSGVSAQATARICLTNTAPTSAQQ